MQDPADEFAGVAEQIDGPSNPVDEVLHLLGAHHRCDRTLQCPGWPAVTR